MIMNFCFLLFETTEELWIFVMVMRCLSLYIQLLPLIEVKLRCWTLWKCCVIVAVMCMIYHIIVIALILSCNLLIVWSRLIFVSALGIVLDLIYEYLTIFYVWTAFPLCTLNSIYSLTHPLHHLRWFHGCLF
jgi:hypothetical protein